MSQHCPACGVEAAADALFCGLCRAVLPRRRHKRPPGIPSAKPAPPQTPVPPLPPDWRSRSISGYLEHLSLGLAPKYPTSPEIPRWFRVVAWLMLGGSLVTGMALAGLLLGLTSAP